jgi:hypothetical protein
VEAVVALYLIDSGQPPGAELSRSHTGIQFSNKKTKSDSGFRPAPLPISIALPRPLTGGTLNAKGRADEIFSSNGPLCSLKRSLPALFLRSSVHMGHYSGHSMGHECVLAAYDQKGV